MKLTKKDIELNIIEQKKYIESNPYGVFNKGLSNINDLNYVTANIDLLNGLIELHNNLSKIKRIK